MCDRCPSPAGPAGQRSGCLETAGRPLAARGQTLGTEGEGSPAQSSLTGDPDKRGRSTWCYSRSSSTSFLLLLLPSPFFRSPTCDKVDGGRRRTRQRGDGRAWETYALGGHSEKRRKSMHRRRTRRDARLAGLWSSEKLRDLTFDGSGRGLRLAVSVSLFDSDAVVGPRHEGTWDRGQGHGGRWEEKMREMSLPLFSSADVLLDCKSTVVGEGLQPDLRSAPQLVCRSVMVRTGTVSRPRESRPPPAVRLKRSLVGSAGFGSGAEMMRRRNLLKSSPRDEVCE